LRSFGFEFVSDFDIRISDFVRWRPFDLAQDMLGSLNFLKLIKENQPSRISRNLELAWPKVNYQPGLSTEREKL
jgi:hypothetical protein